MQISHVSVVELVSFRVAVASSYGSIHHFWQALNPKDVHSKSLQASVSAATRG